MEFECNIDARGKFVRLASGSLGVLVGAFLSALFLLYGVEYGAIWVVPVSLVAGGSFAVFEGWSGWCVARAFGIWTPI